MKIPLSIAEQVGCTKWMIKKINGGTTPSLKLAIAIVKAMEEERWPSPKLVDMIPRLREAAKIMLFQGIG